MGQFLFPQMQRFVGLIQDIRHFAHGKGFHHFRVPALFHRLAVQQIQHLAQGHGAADFIVPHFIHGFPGRYHGRFVVAALGGDGLDAVIGNGEIGQGLGPVGQGQQAAGKHQLENQHEGHHRHGPGGGVADAGNEQAHHIGGVGNEQQGNAQIHDHPGRDEARFREMNAHHFQHVQAQARLRGAQGELIDHVGRDVGGNMHTGTVFPLDDGTLAAYGLDGVEAAVPDAYAGERERALQISLHGEKKVLPDDHGNQRGDDGRHGQHLPVALVHEEAKLLAQINGNLAGPAAMTDFSHAPGFLYIQLSHAAPPQISG